MPVSTNQSGGGWKPTSVPSYSMYGPQFWEDEIGIPEYGAPEIGTGYRYEGGIPDYIREMFGGGGSGGSGGGGGISGDFNVNPNINWDRVRAREVAARGVSPWDGEDEFTNKRAQRAHMDTIEQGGTIADTYARQTGMGRGTPGGAAQASLIALKSAGDAAMARDDVFQDERLFRTGLDVSNADRELQASLANQGAFLTADMANQSTGLNAAMASKAIEAANADRSLQMALSAQQSSLARAGMRSAEYQTILQYDLALRQLGEAARSGDMNARLAFSQLNENARQFTHGLGLNWESLRAQMMQFQQQLQLQYDQMAQQQGQWDDQYEDGTGGAGDPYGPITHGNPYSIGF